MKRTTKRLACLAAALITLTGAVMAVEPGSAEETAQSKKWVCKPVEGLPNVLLIGDSISIGYTLETREILKGKANVYRPILNEKGDPWNCGHTGSILAGLDKMLKGPKWDIIHFNTGLHDLKRINRKKGARSDDLSIPPVFSLDKYKENMEKVVERLKKTGATLIFATTTPVPEGVYPARKPEDAALYNKAALEIMKKHDVAVDDLYKDSLPHLKEWQRHKNVHFSPFGRQKLAELVAKSIESKL